MVTKTRNEEELIKDIQEDAKVRIKNSLVIDKIAKEENIKIAPADLDKKFQELGHCLRGISTGYYETNQ